MLLDMAAIIERKRLKLRKTGGSRSVTLPKAWLDRVGVTSEIDVMEMDDGRLYLAPPQAADTSVEDEPEFALFLNFILKDTLSHPERLADMGDFKSRTDALFSGVDMDA